MFSMLEARPDIAFVTSLVSRFAKNPSHQHTEAVKNIFKYLKGSKDRRITYVAMKSWRLKATRIQIGPATKKVGDQPPDSSWCSMVGQWAGAQRDNLLMFCRVVTAQVDSIIALCDKDSYLMQRVSPLYHTYITSWIVTTCLITSSCVSYWITTPTPYTLLAKKSPPSLIGWLSSRVE